MGQPRAAVQEAVAVETQNRFRSPLRYPGGKGRLAPFLGQLIEENGLTGGHYAEPYAGGGAAALSLLFDEYVSRIHINDLDRGVYAFWHSVLEETDRLCTLIRERPLTMVEWRRQRAVQDACAAASLLDLGFSTFYLNRTNRSGIISGGVIGGKHQDGKWGLGARFNREELVRRVNRVAAYGSRISLYNLDAADFLAEAATSLPERSLIYCDPPYYVKGQRKLYENYYEPADHGVIAEAIQILPVPWIVSYDDAPEIQALYRRRQRRRYDLNYCVEERYRGIEVMFFSDNLCVPRVQNPAYVGRPAFARAPRRKSA